MYAIYLKFFILWFSKSLIKDLEREQERDVYVPRHPSNRIRRRYLTSLADKSLEVRERIQRQLRAKTYK